MSTVQRPAKQSPQKAVPWPKLSLVVCAVFLGIFAYIKFRLNPPLEYQHSGPFLQLTHAFFQPFLGRPGGVGEYAGILLAQLDYWDWTGALAFTLTAFVVWLCALNVIRAITDQRTPIAALIPVILLLVLRNQYGSSVAAVSIGLALGLGAAAASVIRPPVSRSLRVALWAIGSVSLLLIGGMGPALVFALLAGTFEGLKNKRWASGSSGLAAVALVIAILHLLGFSPAQWLVSYKGHLLLTTCTFLSVPVIVWSLVFLSRVTSPAPPHRQRSHAGDSSHHQPKQPWHQAPVWRGVFAVALVLAGCAAVWLTSTPPQRTSAEIDYYDLANQFDKVAEVAHERNSLGLASQIRMHRALYYKGKLAEDLFAYPNQLAMEPLPGVTGGIDSFRAQVRTLLELGLVSDAEHLAHEALEMEGERPDLLLALAEINILKDRPVAAKIFLNVLRTFPFQRRKAESLLAGIDKNPTFAGDKRLDGIRALMVTNDLPHEGMPAEALLAHYLMFNPRNKMAFEYLMTHYLLTLELRKLVDRLWQLETLGYAGIPRHYEEALLLYERVSGAKVSLSRAVRPETLQRFGRFSDAMSRKLYSTREGRLQMSRDFGDTYWYYYYSTQSYLKSLQGGKS